MHGGHHNLENVSTGRCNNQVVERRKALELQPRMGGICAHGGHHSGNGASNLGRLVVSTDSGLAASHAPQRHACLLQYSRTDFQTVVVLAHNGNQLPKTGVSFASLNVS